MCRGGQKMFFDWWQKFCLFLPVPFHVNLHPVEQLSDSQPKSLTMALRSYK